MELLDDEIRVEEELGPGGPEVPSQADRPDDTGVLRDVVGLDPEELGDRRVGSGERIVRVGPVQPEQRRAERRGAGFATGGAVGPDDEPTRRRRRSWAGRGIPDELLGEAEAELVGQAAVPVPGAAPPGRPRPRRRARAGTATSRIRSETSRIAWVM